MVGVDGEANLAKFKKSRLVGEARQAVTGQTFATIESIRSYLEPIYSSAKTIHQLQGELGAEYQRDDDPVIVYANRIRDIQRRILEAKKLSAGRTADAAF